MRKINSGPATANQVRDGWKELKQKYLQKESAIKTFKSRNLFKEPSASYSRFPEIIMTHSVYMYIRTSTKNKEHESTNAKK